MLAVVTAYFGGLSLGGLVLGPYVARSQRPRRWHTWAVSSPWGYGAWLLVAGWRPLTAHSLGMGAEGALVAPGWSAFLCTFCAFLPATVAMGTTLPAMQRPCARERRDARSLAGLYASNTLGAVAGVLATAFYLVPAFGFSRTVVICVALNLACALAAMFAFPQSVTPTPSRSWNRTRADRRYCCGSARADCSALATR